MPLEHAIVMRQDRWIHYSEYVPAIIFIPAMKRIIAPAFVIALFLITGCAEGDDRTDMDDDDVEGVQNEIEAVNARFESYIAGQQWDSLALIYTDDAVMMPQGAPMERGPDRIRQGFMQMGQMGVTAAELETEDVEVEGDMAYEMGHYTLRGGGAEMDRGKYLVVWKHEDGDWKIHRDMFSSDSPMPGGGMMSDTMGMGPGMMPGEMGRMPGDTAGVGAMPDEQMMPDEGTTPDDTTSAF